MSEFGFEQVLNSCEERFGALNAGDESDLTIYLLNGEPIKANAVGVDYDDNILRHFTWETLDDEKLRKLFEDEPVSLEEVKEEISVEIGEQFLVMNGMIPWTNVAELRIETDHII